MINVGFIDVQILIIEVKQLLLYIISFFPLLVSAQTQVTEYNPGATADGVVYALPRTVINADVSAIKTEYVPGEFAKYAERYLHIQGVKRQPETTWTVTGLSVYTEGEPDTLKMFTIKQKDKSSAANVQFTRNGVLSAINTEQEFESHILPQSTSTHHARDGKKYLTAEMLEASSSAKMAELVAQEIFDIRDSKNTIRRGQAESMPKDGASLRIVLDDLDEQEEALMQMFVGYTDTTFVYENYSVAPTEDINKEVLFRFSQKVGFVDNDDLQGEPYYITVTDKHSVQMPNEKEAAKRKISGVVYNVPGSARVLISTMTTNLYDQEVKMGQFGNVDILNNALFNKGAAPKVTFNTSTGALLRIE